MRIGQRPPLGKEFIQVIPKLLENQGQVLGPSKVLLPLDVPTQNNGEWSFDDQMEVYGCQVHTFDPSVWYSIIIDAF